MGSNNLLPGHYRECYAPAVGFLKGIKIHFQCVFDEVELILRFAWVLKTCD